jgi:uncharacterized membrane protein YgaE (UPF0421/DUF939 family)
MKRPLERATQYTGIGVALGAGAGVVIGALVGRSAIAIGLSVGAGLGVAIGAAMDLRRSQS